MLGPLTSLNSQVASSLSNVPKGEQFAVGREQNKQQSDRLKETKPQGTETAEAQDNETRNPYSPFQTAYSADAAPAPLPNGSARGSNINIIV
ncbi:MAG: hypothetical protein CMH25_00465 [Micavibrio sp.]|nr:hypothetical protein [Micavibrio sp.]|tara:strand:+ start:1624 stop:1899 length:276 start_codon:yes stop_codon:yes gene_type:complete